VAKKGGRGAAMELVFVALQNQLLTRHTGVGIRPTTQVTAGRSISRVAAAAPAASFKSRSVEKSGQRGGRPVYDRTGRALATHRQSTDVRDEPVSKCDRCSSTSRRPWIPGRPGYPTAERSGQRRPRR
jgi:hypothetical protein